MSIDKLTSQVSKTRLGEQKSPTETWQVGKPGGPESPIESQDAWHTAPRPWVSQGLRLRLSSGAACFAWGPLAAPFQRGSEFRETRPVVLGQGFRPPAVKAFIGLLSCPGPFPQLPEPVRDSWSASGFLSSSYFNESFKSYKGNKQGCKQLNCSKVGRVTGVV